MRKLEAANAKLETSNADLQASNADLQARYLASIHQYELFINSAHKSCTLIHALVCVNQHCEATVRTCSLTLPCRCLQSQPLRKGMLIMHLAGQ
jgi:hypothetical protein